MREIRQSGSEGGEPQPNAASLPLSASGFVQLVEAIGCFATRTLLSHRGHAVECCESHPSSSSTIWRWWLPQAVLCSLSKQWDAS